MTKLKKLCKTVPFDAVADSKDLLAGIVGHQGADSDCSRGEEVAVMVTSKSRQELEAIIDRMQADDNAATAMQVIGILIQAHETLQTRADFVRVAAMRMGVIASAKGIIDLAQKPSQKKTKRAA